MSNLLKHSTAVGAGGWIILSATMGERKDGFWELKMHFRWSCFVVRRQSWRMLSRKPSWEDSTDLAPLSWPSDLLMACVMWTTGVDMIQTVHFLEKWHPVGLSPPLGFAAIRHVMLLILQMLLFNASSFKFSQRLDPWANVFSICNHLSYLIYFLKRLNGIGLPLQCIQTEQFAAILKALFVFACAFKTF